MGVGFGNGDFGNKLGIRTVEIDFDAEGSPATKTYHGLAIVYNNQNIGRIQGWNPQMYSRAGTHVYELNSYTFGRVVDYVPGINQNYMISCSRVEMWNNEFEIALGYQSTWIDLIDQNKAFTITEALYRGTALYRQWVYKGCWFQDRNEQDFSAEGDAKVVANASIAFITRQRVVGLAYVYYSKVPGHYTLCAGKLLFVYHKLSYFQSQRSSSSQARS
jgi:hypothetical protein